MADRTETTAPMHPDPQSIGEHPRGSSWCHPVRRGAADGDPTWCWCRHEIVSGIGQCPECQEDEDV